MLDSKCLVDRASTSEASITNKHIAGCITQRLVKQLPARAGCLDPWNFPFKKCWVNQSSDHLTMLFSSLSLISALTFVSLCQLGVNLWNPRHPTLDPKKRQSPGSTLSPHNFTVALGHAVYSPELVRNFVLSSLMVFCWSASYNHKNARAGLATERLGGLVTIAF